MPADPIQSLYRLSDDELDFKIARAATILDSFAGAFDAMLAESDRRGGAMQVALTAPAFAYLDAHRDAALATGAAQ